MTEPNAWVLYDDSCGICRRWIPAWERTLARRGIATAPLQAPWVAERLALEPEERLRDLLMLGADGTLWRGADVYREAMRRIGWARPLGWLASAPLLRRIFDRAYRAFADHRHAISNACRLPGGE